MPTIKLPKKFRDACDLIRGGKNQEGLERLKAFEDKFPVQINAILAEIYYFDGQWDKALDYDLTLLGHWDDWHYSNIMTEHLAAMSFAARKLGKEKQVSSIFAKEILTLEKDTELAPNIRNGRITSYQNMRKYLQTGIVPHFSKNEVYNLPEHIRDYEDILADLKSKDKKFDLSKTDSKSKLLFNLYQEARPQAVLDFYHMFNKDEIIGTLNLMQVLQVCNYLKEEELAKEIICRMTRDKLWFIASPTQVRPMEFFTHPALFSHLEQDEVLKMIVNEL